MKKAIIFIVGTLFVCGVGSPIHAGSEDENLRMWGQVYEKALKDLRYGSTYEKLNAIVLMGAHKKERFIRPLGKELLNHLVNRKLLKMSENDPYIKARIAWALGQIGNKHSIGTLVQALDLSYDLAKKENEVIRKKRSQLQKVEETHRKAQEDILAKNRQELGNTKSKPKDDKYRVKIVTMGYDRPGPFLGKGYSFPNSADMNWSLADAFRGGVYNYKYESQRIRMKEGANWLNLSRAIFAALGEIGHVSATDAIKKHLDSEYSIMRGYAAQALGEISKKENSAILSVKEKYKSEKDDGVRAYMAYAILVNDKTQYPYYLDLLEYLRSDVLRFRYDAIRVLDALGMGESENDLRAALKIESSELLRTMLKKAIYKAHVDNIMPVNY